MGVMAASVHDPLMPGDIFHFIGLLDGQGVHIGPEGNGLSRLSSPDLSHKAAVAFIFSKWDPHFCQLLYYICPVSYTHLPNEEAYQKMIELNADEINHLLKQQKQLEKVLGNYDYGSDKYNETASELQEIDNTISELIQQQQEYNDAILQIPIKEIQKQVDALASRCV